MSISSIEASNASASLASQPYTMTTRGTQSISVPPHLRHQSVQSTTIPPHLRHGNRTGSVSSESNIYENLSHVSATRPKSSIVQNHPHPITYVGYDPSGEAHVMQRIPSNTQESTSSATSVLESVRTEKPKVGKGKGTATVSLNQCLSSMQGANDYRIIHQEALSSNDPPSKHLLVNQQRLPITTQVSPTITTTGSEWSITSLSLFLEDKFQIASETLACGPSSDLFSTSYQFYVSLQALKSAFL